MSFFFIDTGRSPHGERGLKSRKAARAVHMLFRRSPHGERGLKFCELSVSLSMACRYPHGERGLKYRHQNRNVDIREVALLMESVD